MGPQGLEWEVCDAIFYVKNGHVNNIVSHGVSTVPPGTSCVDGFWEQGLVGPGKTGELVPALGLLRTCTLSTHISEGKERAAGERQGGMGRLFMGSASTGLWSIECQTQGDN